MSEPHPQTSLESPLPPLPWPPPRRRRRRTVEGMTLIEILIVVTIMALIAGAVGVSVMSAMRDARGKQARTDAQTLSSIATRFVLDHGRCPTSAQDLVEAGLTNRHGRTEDPWGGDYRFECEDDDVVAISPGPDGVFETEDDVRP